MTKRTPAKPWRILGICAVSIGVILVILWAVLSLLFPRRISVQLEGVLLNQEGERTEAVELSFEGEWSPRLVQAICGGKSDYVYSGELTLNRNGSEEKVSVAAEPQANVYDGWQDVLCVSSSGSPGKPLVFWGKEASPLVIWQKDKGILATSLTVADGEALLLICAEHTLTEDEVTQASQRWVGLT